MKKSCRSCQKLFNGIWHATYTQGNRVDSWLSVVGSQIANLTPGPSFDHNLCFKCLNGSCKPISDIYIPKSFQWYKICFNPMSFDPCNYFLNIWKFIETPTPKVGVPLGVWGFIPSHFLAFPGAWNVTLELPSWLALLQALALVTNPRLGLRHLSFFKYRHEFFSKNCRWRWQSIALHHKMLSSLVHAHRYEQPLKAWKPWSLYF